MRYAANTEVSTDQTRAEIEKTLRRYGATHYGIMVEPGKAHVQFAVHDRMVKFELKLPNREEFALTDVKKQRRSPEAQTDAFDQACRQRWRALALSIKSKLEAVESKINTFESEFLANIVMANGQTVGDFVVPQIAEMYLNKGMPRMLPGIGGTEN